ncbi:MULTISPECIES: protocatechuate 3,4-dioxygenase subunit alpha [Streptomyces]|uniref:Protocatechuate 3,4-dioxygenase subunit alpha n=1 Tax=Streptomyces thermoviolaceus subsp. thermoviolaceus TaxID=66860 RepID=A0ABX0YWT2_STRTL|nr:MULTISPECIES: protocatechuate 3,4-dioxygenase subunit alpha [Streptomyces]MCM3265630.1 protocatechuate 3,4-dioxygenase subunit alpha [Streptomyces thermoviolaceus]NJP16563.1 protocatechuate 3,4-dioxygenase subunit alpha [Streptomyces thermoviolaceus subsp. thermoviolaceus]RSS05569.1 protocatechuate 3,4-dioxygenase subunit alpha [Streptomyces sp. WAC00469]WTD46542.1 protocatechuate 3,4-dioxygenase subunit alpha [Streptomyces thermoviolaceus]GGV82151.1 protocatechuate 3,4-dioxygenase subunit 
MTTTDTSRPGTVPPTPSQTVGPFYGYALPFRGGEDVAPLGHPDTVTVHGYVTDGEGRPLPDALLEVWGPAPDGTLPAVDGSMRRDPATGAVLGRNGVEFTGFGRVQTDADGHWYVRTLRPGARGGNAPYLSVCVFARGLLHHLFTRIYVPGDDAALAGDPLLSRLEDERRATLIAAEESVGTYRFDIRLQGEGETVFLEFR